MILHEKLGRFQMSESAGQVQGRMAERILGIHVRTLGEKEGYDSLVILDNGKVNGGATILIPAVDLGSSIQEKPHDILLSMLGRLVKSGTSLPILGIHFHTTG
jgi:hypothetical protein